MATGESEPALTETVSGCPNVQTLKAVLLQEHTLDEMLAEHLASCSNCQQQLDRLSSSEFLDRIVAQRGDLSAPPPYLEESENEYDLGLISHFQVRELIGRGGMGTVYRAYDSQLDREVAIKVLSNVGSGSADVRFLRESRAAGKLENDYVVSVYHVGRTIDDRPFLVMPLIDGKSLAEMLRDGPITPRESAQLIREAALGLAAAHDAGLVHRDVKPANILVAASDRRARITDFGLVRVSNESSMTREDVLCGTPQYMSPEQASSNSEVDARSDIYSLGATLYTCLTGLPPFQGSALDVLEQHRSFNPCPPARLNRAVPGDLETICLKALEKRPDNRYQSGREFADDIERFLQGVPIWARPASMWRRATYWIGRNPIPATLTALLALALMGGTLFSTIMWLHSRESANEAMAATAKLKDSQVRLRDSVRSFQAQVFSGESLHWQMTPAFRTNMFRTVISYLDEFSVQEPIAAEGVNSNGDLLVDDYLSVARWAAQVGDLEQAAVAAQQALARCRRYDTVALPSSSKIWIQWSEAALLLHDFSSMLQRLPSERHALLIDEAQRSLSKFKGVSSEEPLVQWLRLKVAAAPMISTSLIGSATPQHDVTQVVHNAATAGDVRSANIRSLFEQVVNFEFDQVSDARRLEYVELLMALGNQIAWAEPIEPALVTFEQVRRKLSLYREYLRQEKKTLWLTDAVFGRHYLTVARRLLHADNSQQALTNAMQSFDFLTESINHSPQNRNLRVELIRTLELIFSIHQKQSNHLQAAKALDQALRNMIKIVESEPDNMELRGAIIIGFVKMSDLSIALNTPADAARELRIVRKDCILLMSDPRYHRWTIEIYCWTSRRAISIAEEFDLKELQASLNSESNEFSRLFEGKISEDDWQLLQQGLKGDEIPPRPPDFPVPWK
jgi:serine/threonine protein kinase